MAKGSPKQPNPSPAMANEPTTAGPEVLAVLSDEYMGAIGRVSAAWAILDVQLDMAICGFTHTPQFLGVCVTSQIFSTPSKLTALGGLMRAQGMPERRIKWLDNFHQKTHALGRKRNRAVHDAIMVGSKTGTVYRMSATLDQKKDVMFGVTPSTIEELAEIFEEVKDHVARFQEFYYRSIGELQALRQKVPLSYFQILPTPPPPAPAPAPLPELSQRPRRSSPGRDRQKSK
jgi:hypothetical protein